MVTFRFGGGDTTIEDREIEKILSSLGLLQFNSEPTNFATILASILS